MENLGSLLSGVPGKWGGIRALQQSAAEEALRPLSVTKRVNKSPWGTAKVTPAIGRVSSLEELIDIWSVVKGSSWNKKANIIINTICAT